MDMSKLANKKFLMTGLFILLVGVALLGLNNFQNDDGYSDTVPVRDNRSLAQTDSGYSVDCPDEVIDYCVSVAEEYEGNVSHMYEAEYTGMNGSKQFVRLVSNDLVADTGANNVTIDFDTESGRVWSVQEAQ